MKMVAMVRASTSAWVVVRAGRVPGHLARPLSLVCPLYGRLGVRNHRDM